jgi:hypothetical protein
MSLLVLASVVVWTTAAFAGIAAGTAVVVAYWQLAIRDRPRLSLRCSHSNVSPREGVSAGAALSVSFRSAARSPPASRSSPSF